MTLYFWRNGISLEKRGNQDMKKILSKMPGVYQYKKCFLFSLTFFQHSCSAIFFVTFPNYLVLPSCQTVTEPVSLFNCITLDTVCHHFQLLASHYFLPALFWWICSLFSHIVQLLPWRRRDGWTMSFINRGSKCSLWE